jgi:hypothetical protein
MADERPCIAVPFDLLRWSWDDREGVLWYGGASSIAIMYSESNRKDGGRGAQLTVASDPDPACRASLFITYGKNAAGDPEGDALRAAEHLGLVRRSD